MTLTPEQIERLLQAGAFASGEEDTELFCDAVQPLLAAYVEAELAGDDPAGRDPRGSAALARHLRWCGDCREEYAALREILSDTSPPPDVAPDWRRVPPPPAASQRELAPKGHPAAGAAKNPPASLIGRLRALLDQVPQAIGAAHPGGRDSFRVALPDVAEPLELILTRAAGSDARLLGGQIKRLPAHLGGARLDLYDAQSFAAIGSATLSGQGRFDFAGVAPGQYILTIAAGDMQSLLLRIHPSFLEER